MNKKQTGSQFEELSSTITNKIDKAVKALLNTEATATVTDSCCGAAGDVEKTFPRLFDCQDNQKFALRLCTEKDFDSMLDDQRVASITEEISKAFQRMKLGEITPEQYAKIKRGLKDQLPTFVFGGHSQTGARTNADILPSVLPRSI